MKLRPVVPSGDWAGHRIRKARKAGQCDYFEPCSNLINVGDLYVESERYGAINGTRKRYCLDHVPEVPRPAEIESWRKEFPTLARWYDDAADLKHDGPPMSEKELFRMAHKRKYRPGRGKATDDIRPSYTRKLDALYEIASGTGNTLDALHADAPKPEDLTDEDLAARELMPDDPLRILLERESEDDDEPGPGPGA